MGACGEEQRPETAATEERCTEEPTGDYHDATSGAGVVTWVTRHAANLVATERARQSSCANEGATKLSIVTGGPQRRPCSCDAERR